MAQSTLFSDDFNDGNANGWTTSGGTWTVNTNEYLNTSSGLSTEGNSAWTDYSVEAKVKPVVSTYAGIIGRYQSNSNYYQLEVHAGNNKLSLWRNSGGSWTEIGSYPTTINTGTAYTLKLDMNGSTLSGYLNGTLRISASDSTHSSGKIGVRNGNDARYDDVVVLGVSSGVDAFSQIEAEGFDSQSGLGIYSGGTGQKIGSIENGTWARYDDVDFGSGASSFSASVASNTSGGTIQLRLGSTSGTLIGSAAVSGTGGWNNFTTVNTSVSGASGMQDLYLVFTGGSGSLLDVDYFVFSTGSSQVAAPQFSPGGGSYSSTQSVSITSATSGSTIRYTTNGSTPTSSSGTVYSGSISVSSTTTLKAIAYKSGMTDSSVSTASYTITTGGGGTPSQNILLTSAVAPGTVSPGSLTDGVVIGVVSGSSSRSVELHGTGTSGTTPQVRIRRQSDVSLVQNWTTLSSISWDGSNWTGVVSLPKGDDWWLTDLRYLEDTSNSLGYQTTNSTKWAVGYKIMVIGQSQLWRWYGHVWSSDPTTFSTGMNGIVSFFSYGSAGSISVLSNSSGVTDGIAQTANIVGDGDPTPTMFFSEWYSGTGIDQFLDDNDTSRSWSDLQDRVDDYGTDFTATVSLYGSDTIRMDNHYPKPPYTFEREIYACADWTTGDVQHSTSNGIVEHYFDDACQTGTVHTFACIPRYAVNGNDSSGNELLIDELNTRGLAYGCPTGDMTMEVEPDGGIANQHSEEQGPGARAMGKSMGVALRRGMGLSAPVNPYFAGTGIRSANGTYIEIDVVRPNGGNLYSRAPNALSSFSVSENSGSSYSGSGFTASISGNKVRLTKNSGTWATSSSLRVRKVGNLDNHDDTQTTDQTIVNGELYEVIGGVYRDGIPVHGVLSGGDWRFPYYSVISSISQQ